MRQKEEEKDAERVMMKRSEKMERMLSEASLMKEERNWQIVMQSADSLSSLP
jgi:hypothetical protein